MKHNYDKKLEDINIDDIEIINYSSNKVIKLICNPWISIWSILMINILIENFIIFFLIIYDIIYKSILIIKSLNH